jgi:hypothetical protein
MIAVRNFVCCHCLQRAKVTCQQELDYFIKENFAYTTTDTSDQQKLKAFHAAYCATLLGQRFWQIQTRKTTWQSGTKERKLCQESLLSQKVI